MHGFYGTENKRCAGMYAYENALVTNGRRLPYIKGLLMQECFSRNQAWLWADYKGQRPYMHATKVCASVIAY